MKKFIIFFFIAISLIITGCQTDKNNEQKELTISAAASLREALEETGQKYMEDHPDVKIIFNFGGSGSLQQQIAQGAPVDLFISAAEDKYNQLLAKDMIDKNHSTQLLGNELVLIVPKEKQNIESLDDLLKTDIKRIAIGTPETVPAGQYARQTFISTGLWSRLESKIINTKDVRQVLSYVETENVDAGIVYKTDAIISDKIKTIPISGHGLHDPIIYPAGVISSSKNADESTQFFEFLKTQDVMDIFKKYGFKAALD
ncbi:molybdate ABC transporter substrate-binding protein [Heyndrickxia sp. MSNUG]|uniref:molybdate ABC transporter substrate-binding protein n=1 Tax=Heyndrickxia sp. MSNUG TaxID=3136677 RepID=UPI003C2AF19C